MLCPSSDGFLKLFSSLPAPLDGHSLILGAWLHSHMFQQEVVKLFASSPGHGFKLKEGRSRLPEKDGFYNEGGEAQRSCGCPTSGSIQGQVGWGLE